MLFSSNIFLFLFLPAFLCIYALIALVFRKRVHASNLFLIAFSLFFYLWGNGHYVWLLIISIMVNTVLAKIIERIQNKRFVVAVGILLNLLPLIYFKYAHFAFGWIPGISPYFSVALPVGISFYTFMAISYLVDVAKERYPAAGLPNFATYLSLFPHLVAGPIVRYSEIQDEIKSRSYSLEDVYEGAMRFCIGIGKKVVIADSLGRVADKAFSLPLNELSWKTAWIAVILYTFQIFYDFSGYSDMAIGLARMLGFRFPENFNLPYTSASLTEFWQRWHMTLRNWFVEYVYIPLGGNRKGNTRTYLNIFMVFLLTGIWHGAAWTFIIWGIYNGLILIIERYVYLRRGIKGKGILATAFTFFLVMIGWVFFRRSTLSDAEYHLQTMAGMHTPAQEFFTPAFFLNPRTLTILVFAIIAAFVPLPAIIARLERSQPVIATAVKTLVALSALAYAILLLSKVQFTPFIYFQF